MLRVRVPSITSGYRVSALILLWSCTVAAGSLGLAWYSFQPGQNRVPPRVWPTASRLTLDGKRLTLVLFVHPRCPCTGASLEELAGLMADGRLRAYVVFFSPETAGDEWSKTRLWRSAETIPGVIPFLDHEGEQARLFGAGTSGQTVVYDATGKIVFAGGITSARGHAGDNEGRRAIAALLDGDGPRFRTTPAFGCSLAASP